MRFIKKKQVNKTITKEAIKIVGNKMYSLEELRQHLYDCVGHFKSNHAVFHKDVDEWIDNTHYVIASYHPNVINTSKK